MPKTGSRSMRRWLAKHYDGKDLLLCHDWKIPPEYYSYFIFTLVRNPYNRCLSRFRFEAKGKNFIEYMKNLIHLRDHPEIVNFETPEQCMTQKQYILKSKIKKVLYLEHLAGIKELPFVKEPLPAFLHLNKTTIHPGRFLNKLSQEEEQAIWEYCAEDFDFLGYARMTFPGRSYLDKPREKKTHI
tara:strand:+ start:2239 stop:2793 length:555 start_codon:yes stop_codon:yes gene_type:complete